MSRQHLYSRIFDDIKGKIISGEIHAGDYIPPISALRSAFGVSHITVLHALKELAAEGLIAKDPGCGYVAAELPNPNIYVGCLLRSNSVSGRDQYFNEIISGVQNAALTAGVNMVFPYSSAMFPSFPKFQQEIVRTALQMKSLVKGYLLDEWLSDNSISEIVKATGRPVVLVNRPTQLPVHAVCSDDLTLTALPGPPVCFQLEFDREVAAHIGFEVESEGGASLVLEYQEGSAPQYWLQDVFPEQAVDTVREDLIQVIENPEGTGAAARVEGAALAGKTGTAEIKDSQSDTEGTELGWFNVFTTDLPEDRAFLLVSMVEDVKDRGGSGYVIDRSRDLLSSYLADSAF